MSSSWPAIVGILFKMPVMLSVVRVVNLSRGRYEQPQVGGA